jgi:hypothetical protein
MPVTFYGFAFEVKMKLWKSPGFLNIFVLTQLMLIPELSSFRLVGGTALSLLLGHRESVDIDLFSDNVYGKTFFNQIYSRLKLLFPIVEQAGPLDIQKTR